jgi:hypothetical protein
MLKAHRRVRVIGIQRNSTPWSGQSLRQEIDGVPQSLEVDLPGRHLVLEAD